jgi:hypothetical protein
MQSSPWTLVCACTHVRTQDYKATQKLAQEREAASLPRPDPTLAAGVGKRPVTGPDLEQGTQLQDMSERQALLQARVLIWLCECCVAQVCACAAPT